MPILPKVRFAVKQRLLKHLRQCRTINPARNKSKVASCGREDTTP